MPPKPPEILRKLQREGWEVKNQKGSHVKLVKENKFLILPYHNKELKKGTWEAIKKQAGWK